MDYIFNTGPFGRYIMVDEDGRLLATTEDLTNGYPYAAGSTGRVVTVDPSGYLKINLRMIASAFKSLTSASGITADCSKYNNFYIPLAHNATITPVSGVDGGKYLFVIKQTVGNNTITFGNILWVNGSAISATAASGSVDYVAMVWVPQLNNFIGQTGPDCKLA